MLRAVRLGLQRRPCSATSHTLIAPRAVRHASTMQAVRYPYPTTPHPTPHQIFHLSPGSSQDQIKDRCESLSLYSYAITLTCLFRFRACSCTPSGRTRLALLAVDRCADALPRDQESVRYTPRYAAWCGWRRTRRKHGCPCKARPGRGYLASQAGPSCGRLWVRWRRPLEGPGPCRPRPCGLYSPRHYI
jgi:hypothetical protein